MKEAVKKRPHIVLFELNKTFRKSKSIEQKTLFARCWGWERELTANRHRGLIGVMETLSKWVVVMITQVI